MSNEYKVDRAKLAYCSFKIKNKKNNTTPGPGPVTPSSFVCLYVMSGDTVINGGTTVTFEMPFVVSFLYPEADTRRPVLIRFQELQWRISPPPLILIVVPGLASAGTSRARCQQLLPIIPFPQLVAAVGPSVLTDSCG